MCACVMCACVICVMCACVMCACVHLFVVVLSCSTLTSCLISRELMQSTKTTESTRYGTFFISCLCLLVCCSFPHVYWSVVHFLMFTGLLFISCLCLLVCCSFPHVYWSVVHFLTFTDLSAYFLMFTGLSVYFLTFTGLSVHFLTFTGLLFISSRLLVCCSFPHVYRSVCLFPHVYWSVCSFPVYVYYEWSIVCDNVPRQFFFRLKVFMIDIVRYCLLPPLPDSAELHVHHAQ